MQCCLKEKLSNRLLVKGILNVLCFSVIKIQYLSLVEGRSTVTASN
jgi:hypothetical protein